MLHQILRSHKDISHHLYRLGVLKFDMLLLAFRFLEMLVDEFPEFPPFFTLVHHQGMVATSDKVVGDIRSWPVTVNGAFLVNEGFDQAAVCEHYGCSRSKLQGKDAPVFLSPFGKP